MTRLLGVDYGTVRVGLAVTDADRKIASPLATYTRQSKERDEHFFKQMLEEEGITTTVRKRKGADIDAACGQLRLRHELEAAT